MRVFQYITFRAVMAAMTSLLIGLVVRAVGDPPADRAQDRPADPRLRRRGAPCKTGTPTMGGVLILLGIGVSTLLWFDW